MTAIGIFGSAGRMGQAIAEVIADLDATLAGGIDAGGDPGSLAKAADVLGRFSTPAALEANLAAARAAGTPIVIGTTGLTHAHHALIDAAARDIAVLQTGNTSLGVTLLAKLVREAAARLGPDWDIEILEMHHRHKADAPSGTALLLGEAAASGRNIALADARVGDRAGLTGARVEGTIGFASLRGGSVAGDHLVVLAGDGERIEIGHRAEIARSSRAARSPQHSGSPTSPPDVTAWMRCWACEQGRCGRILRAPRRRQSASRNRTRFWQSLPARRRGRAVRAGHRCGR